MNRRILITGSNGQLGSEIRILSNQEYPDFIFFFTDVEELDICDISQIESFVEKNKINTIINCAAYTAVDNAEEDKERAMSINATATKNLALITEKNKGQLIHISTDYVFKGINHTPYIESESVDPINYYGFSKLEGEKQIMNLPINAQIIRTSWLYSSFGNNFVKTIMKLAKDRDQLKVIFDQIGTPTYASDLAKTILDILLVDTKGSNEPSLYHYSNEGVASWFDFAKAIIDICELDTKVVPVGSAEFPTKAARPNYSVLDKGKIKSVYKVDIPYWRDALVECITKIKENE